MKPELDREGVAAPPRTNGELSFEHPWQGRLFATTMAACDANLIDYDVFRDHLIAEIARRDDEAAGEYWSAWQDAFEKLGLELGLFGSGEIDDRAAAFAAHT